MTTRRISNRAITILLVVAIINLGMNRSAQGFDSFCITVHSDITSDVLKIFQASPCAITKVSAANQGQDQLDSEGVLDIPAACNAVGGIQYLLKYKQSPHYQAFHHFDRIPATSSIGAELASNLNDFLDSRAYITTEWHNVQIDMAAGNNDAALAALGRALHAVQDFFAHSDYVDLEYGLLGKPGDDQTALAALLDRNNVLLPPNSLLFTSYGYSPTSTSLEQPPDLLGYTHGTFAKDSPKKNVESQILLGSGITKFDAAKSAAFLASFQFVSSIPKIGDLLQNACPANHPPTKTLPAHITENGDPNEKSGPLGSGNGQWLVPRSPVAYAIFFTNESAATAPVQQVTITDTVDVAKFEMNNVTIGLINAAGNIVTPPALPLAQNPFSGTIDLRPAQTLLVRVTAALDGNSGNLTWVLSSLYRLPGSRRPIPWWDFSRRALRALSF